MAASGKLYYRTAGGAWAAVAVGGGGGSATGDYIPEDGWVAISDTLTYASATTFTVSGDLTATFQKGTKFKLTQTTVKYFYVTASAYVDPTTTVTITGGSDYTLANASIDTPYYSYIDNPLGFPDWFNYTPVWSALGSMTVTVTTLYCAAFSIKGKTAFMKVHAEVTLGGTAYSVLIATLPVNYNKTITPVVGAARYFGNAGIVAGYCYPISGPPDILYMRRYDAANFNLGTGRVIAGSIYYDIE